MKDNGTDYHAEEHRQFRSRLQRIEYALWSIAALLIGSGLMDRVPW